MKLQKPDRYFWKGVGYALLTFFACQACDNLIGHCFNAYAFAIGALFTLLYDNKREIDKILAILNER